MARVHLMTSLESSFDAARESAVSVLSDLARRGVELDAEILGFSVGRQAALSVEKMVSVDSPVEVAVIPIRITDVEHPHAFPSFVGEFELVATAESEVEMALEGDYHPPAGAAGAALDMVALHTVAESAVRSFFEDVAGRIELAGRSYEALQGVPI